MRSRASLGCGPTRGSVAQAVCGTGYGWAARSAAAGQETHIRCAAAPARSAAIGVAAAARVGRVGWRYPGRGARRYGRCGLAGAAPRRHSAAPAPLVVRQYRPAVCCESGRYYRLVLETPGECAGAQCRRKAVDPGLGTGDRLCSTSSGKIVQGLKSTYKRHGTVNLFAALEVATGIIRGKTTQTKKRVDFQAFIAEIIADQPSDRQIHVILNNSAPSRTNWLPRTLM